MENTENEKQLDLAVLWHALRRFWWIVIIATILCGAIGAVATKAMVKQTYTSTTRYFISPGKDPTSGQIYVTQTFAKQFVEIAKMDTTIRDAINTNGASCGIVYQDDDQVKRIGRMLELSINDESFMFSLSVTASTAGEAYDVARMLEAYLPGKLTNSASGAVSVEVADKATPSNTPNSTHLLRNTALGAVVGLAVSYLVCLFIVMSDNKLSSEDDLTTNFPTVPILGRIPTWGDTSKRQFRLEKKNKFSASVRDYDHKLLSDDAPFAISESFKTLRSNVSYTMTSERTNVVAVTSIYKGSGKSVVLANLGISYAQLGKRVLIVEGDMRVPSMHKLFGMKRGNGLSELIAGIEEDYHTCLNHTSYDHLDVILAGKIPPNPSELLASPRMSQLLDTLRGDYDLILLDLPPFEGLADATAVSDNVDGYLLVTRVGYSNMVELRHGIQDMKQVKLRLCGFVVNDIPLKNGHGSYYHYYRYGYKGGYGYQGVEYGNHAGTSGRDKHDGKQK